MSHLINIFIEPGKTFESLKEKPTFALPLILLTVATAVSTLLYFLHVDPEWFSNFQLQAMAAEMSKAEVEQAKQFMPGASATGWISFASILIFVPVMYLIMAVYYLLAGKVTGNPTSFRHGLSLGAWASMPMLLAAIVAIVGVYTNSPQTPQSDLQMLNIDPLFVQLPLDHPWSTLAKMFSLLNFWVWFLAALGWKTWYRTGWGQALFVVLLPSVVIYGAMALFAAF